MSIPTLPPDLGQFVQEQVAAGNYQTEQELVADAVRVLRELQARQTLFHEDVRLGMEQLGRGEFIEYDDVGLRGLFDELKLRVQNRRAPGH
jgi:Arc/MetJ-type ribon-helix-helix transcriptional regulator